MENILSICLFDYLRARKTQKHKHRKKILLLKIQINKLTKINFSNF